MGDYKEINIPVGVATDELVDFILNHDFSDTKLSYVIDSVERQRQRYIDQNPGYVFDTPVPTTPLAAIKEWYDVNENTASLSFSSESSYVNNHTEEPICIELRKRGIPYEYYQSWDEDNDDITLWTEHGEVTYDVDRSSNIILPYDKISEAMDLPSDAMKVKALEKILAESSPWALPSLESYTKKVQKKEDVIGNVLARFDNGEITQEQAFAEIAEFKAKGA